MGCKDSLNLNAAILRDIQNSLDMSHALFPSEEQIKELVNKPYIELSSALRFEIETSDVQKSDLI